MAIEGGGGSATTYYTFNDCCTGIPFKIRGFIAVFEYTTGACVPGACPEDMLGKIITEAYPECSGECLPIVSGCLELTEITSFDPGTALVEDFFVINDFQSVPTCEDCKTCVYYTLNDCCTKEPYILNGLLDPDLNNTIAVFAYQGECFPGACPGDIISSIITSVSAESFGGIYIEGCLELTEIQAIPADSSLLEWDNFFQEATTVPSCQQCQTCYYEITNCTDSNEKYCTTSNLFQYINNNIENPSAWPVIETTQFPDKCFYVEQVSLCTAPITINVTSSVISCAQCQQKLLVYYELINCNNPAIIVYTSTNLSDYVNKYITLEEYGDQCFYVTVANELIPSDVPVTPKDPYDTCEACSLPRYILEDCLGIADPIITQTNLSAYIGSVITLETCPDICWTVSETDITTLSSDVYIDQEFASCPLCLANTLPSTCVTFTNTTSKEENFDVVTYEGVVTKYTVGANSTLPKSCLISWNVPVGIVVTEYGDCTNGVCPTPVPQPKRKVTPGYNTPACTAEYYEKVECTFSEWMYKDVLEKRYGISNCCPADLMRWEIKHEMLMLDALINPDYTCVPPVNCGCSQPSTCNCSCNSGN
jgi:hypothetical protein